jgi:hypothetical protein
VAGQAIVKDGTGQRAEPRPVSVYEAASGRRAWVCPDAGYGGQLAFAPDCRTLAVAGPDAITFWDLATSKPVQRIAATVRCNGSYGPSFASGMAFSPDGRRLITGHIDTTALVWEVRPAAREPRPLADREREQFWADLGGADAMKAFAAGRALADDPGAAAFLRGKLRPPYRSPSIR